MKKQFIIGILIIVIMLLIPNYSKAGLTSISDGTQWTNITISEAYDVCYNLRAPTSTLAKTESNVDPHLTLNKDWGAAAYLGLSQYGEVRTSTGPTTTDSKHTTTTGNYTGVMDLGKKYEWTSSLIKGGGTNKKENRTNLTNKLGTKYVEELESNANTNIENSKGLALAETKGWYSSYAYWSAGYPCFVRKGVLGFGNYSGGYVYGDYNGRCRCKYNIQTNNLELKLKL